MSDNTYWIKLGLHLILVWAAIFGFYEIIERIYLKNAGGELLHTLHFLRGTLTAFLLALLGTRSVYRSREASIVCSKEGLAAEKSKQDEILASIGAGLIVLDADYKVRYANDQAQKWLGTKISDRLCVVSDCPMGKETGICPSRESVIRKGRVSFEEKLETPQGVRHLYITATPLGGTNGGPPDGIIELIQDVTPLKEMESRLRQTVAAARVGAVAAGIAHQIGNPLASLSAALERLYALGAGKQEAYARYLQRIEMDSDRAARIVRSLMDLAGRIGGNVHPPDDSRVPAGHGWPSVERDRDVKRSTANVCTSVIEAIDAVAETREHIRDVVKLHLPDRPLLAKVGPVDIREVLINLLQNALEATATRERPRIAIHAAEDRGTALVMVCDNGPGVDPASREKIFEPFYTTRRDGTGLGLYLCREIVESCGGEIGVDNLPAGGARFRIRLPAAPTPAMEGPVPNGTGTSTGRPPAVCGKG